MRRFPAAIAVLTGWRRYALAFAAGAATVLALAPFHLWYVALATYSVLIWLVDGVGAGTSSRALRLRDGGRIGWFFGFGYFFTGLYWVGNSFLVEAEDFAWLMPFAVISLPAGLAVFYAAAAAAAAAVWRPGLARVVALGLAVSLAEVARGTLLTGLPWNTLGYALAANEALMQSASLVGVYGLTFVATLVFALPAAMLEPRRPEGRWRLAGPFYGAIVTLVLAGGWGWGAARLAEAKAGQVPDVRLRIVQPNIPQTEKWKPDNRNGIFQTYLELSAGSGQEGGRGLDGITHLVWPESALPFLLAESTAALAAIADVLPEGTSLITGQARAEEELAPDGALRRLRVYNSLFAMNHRARVVQLYDKLHLVPFGEYLPFQDLLESIGLEQLTRVRGGFTPGTGPRFMQPPDAPAFVPLVCYEVIFPHAIRAPGTRPEWMLNVTNDAWFGETIGPYQHFHQARLRAVEQGLPLVRAANTGISAVVDAYGRVVASIPLSMRTTLDSNLPAALPPTVFFRLGWIVELLFSFTFLLLWLILARVGSFGRRI